MSESLELAKEIQRRDKAKFLPGGSQTLIKLAQKYEDNKQKHRNFSETGPAKGYYNRGRRKSDTSILQVNKNSDSKARRHSDVNHYYAPPVKYVTPEIQYSKKDSMNREQQLKAKHSNDENEVSLPKLEMLKMDDTPLEVKEEWVKFLNEQWHEIRRNTDILDNKNYILMIITPLRNINVTELVTRKILKILSVPLEDPTKFSKKLTNSILHAYESVQVTQHLLLAYSISSQKNSELKEILTALITKLMSNKGYSFAEQFVECVLQNPICQNNLHQIKSAYNLICLLIQASQHVKLINESFYKVLESLLSIRIVKEASDDKRCWSGFICLITLWHKICADSETLKEILRWETTQKILSDKETKYLLSNDIIDYIDNYLI